MADAVMVGGKSGGGASWVLFLLFLFLSVSYLGLLSLSFSLKYGFVVFFLFDLNLRFSFGVFSVVWFESQVWVCVFLVLLDFSSFGLWLTCEMCSLSLGLISSVLFFRPETPDGSNPLNRWAKLSSPIRIFGRLRVHFSYTRTNQVGCGSISNPIRPDPWIALHQPIKFQWNVKQLGLQLWRITIIGIVVVFFFISINGWHLTIQFMQIVLAVEKKKEKKKRKEKK